MSAILRYLKFAAVGILVGTIAGVLVFFIAGSWPATFAAMLVSATVNHALHMRHT